MPWAKAMSAWLCSAEIAAPGAAELVGAGAVGAALPVGGGLLARWVGLWLAVVVTWLGVWWVVAPGSVTLRGEVWAPGVLSGHESDRDSVAGARLARALAWADVYLLSGLDREVVEDLSMVPVDRPEDVLRLASRSASCTFVSQAEWTRSFVPDVAASS